MANTLLNDNDTYKRWRDAKLEGAVTSIEAALVEINNPDELSASEKTRVKQLCDQNNFALFQIEPQSDYPSTINRINEQFGLVNFDAHLYVGEQGLAHITPSDNREQGEFIPYTTREIGWHSDGYYNELDRRIRAFSLFCANPALEGGENQWIDQHMLYILLREDNPEVAEALTHPQAMTIPEHRLEGAVRRPVSIGPIFFIDEKTTELYMRYTQRKKYIEFADSAEVQAAVNILDQRLAQTSSYHFRHTMCANQGILCNNVPHTRSAFTNDPNSPRLMLRERFFERI